MKFALIVLTIIFLAPAAPLNFAQTAQGASPTVTGKWHFVLQTDDGERVFDPTFHQDGDKVTGKWGTADVKGTFSEGTLNLEFPYTSDEVGPGTLKINAQLDADVLAGDWSFQDYSGKFRATRVAETQHSNTP